MEKRFNVFRIIRIVNYFLCLILYAHCYSQEVELYPSKYKKLPDIPSPTTLKNGTEVIINVSRLGEYLVLPVTQEKGEIYSCLYDFNGKGDQLWVAAPDFPTLGKTGLHSEEELDKKTLISGRSIDVINFIARPKKFSSSGFISEDEDIISVLKGDNKIIRSLGLVHHQLAKPLFHVWNSILGNYIEQGDENQNTIYYNGNKIYIIYNSGNGYQESIFHDEIEGKYDIHIWRNLDNEELEFLKRYYSKLAEVDFNEFIEKLTHLHLSEMLPFYIMRYGFYEGHTYYRCDPIAIAFIFGLKSLEEIENVFEGNLYNSLTNHYVYK